MSGYGKSAGVLGLDGLSVHDWVSDEGLPNGQSLEGVVSEWASEDTEAQSSMEWVVSDDGSEEDEVSMTVSQFATLLHESKLWRRHKATCDGCACEGS